MPSFNIGRKDLLIIAALLLAAAVSWFAYGRINSAPEPENIYAEIVYEGVKVERVPLDKDGKFSIDGLPNVVLEVKNRKIAFVHSDCPDKVCVNSGWLSAGGHSAACLPNKIIVIIVDESETNEDSVDAVAR